MEARKVMEWKPIETAPKDGTPILGYSDVHYEMAVVHWRRDAWLLIVTGGFAEDDEWSPDQWAPISPPETRRSDWGIV